MSWEDLFDEPFEKKVENDNNTKIHINECRKLLSDKFGDINFIEEGHHYTIDGLEYTPVSNIIKKYEPIVDWDKKAEEFALRHGRKKDDVQKEWKLNNLKSTISGTRTHEFGESYTNLMCGHPELICEQNKPQYLSEFNTLVSTYPKEDAVKEFYENLEYNLHPVGAEFKLSSKYMNNTLPICGTCDILFYDSKHDGYVIGDWKTNKSLIKEYNRKYGIKMTGCMSGYIDEPYNHYTMQFNIYRKMLESVGLKIIDMILIWLKDDGTYERFNISRLSDTIMDKVLKGEE